ncbi:ABC transporter permease [soil metagenome]
MKLRRILRSGGAYLWVGGALLLAATACAVLAPWLAPHDPNAQDLLNTLLPPAWAEGGDPQYLLGTDSLGRCLLSRLIFGTRVAAIVGFAVPTFTALFGGALALLAGYCGKRIDWSVSRLVDVWMSFPPVVLALVLMTTLEPGLHNVIVATVLVDWTLVCRVVRSEVITLAKHDYVTAARICGATHLHVVLHDILPGVAPLMLTLFSIQIGMAVVTESVLSFVGISVGPDTPTWGTMIADGLGAMYQAPSGLVFPMIAIIAIVLGANLLGEGLRRALDPRLQERSVPAA